jgi:hypothetical protein
MGDEGRPAPACCCCGPHGRCAGDRPRTVREYVPGVSDDERPPGVVVVWSPLLCDRMYAAAYPPVPPAPDGADERYFRWWRW